MHKKDIGIRLAVQCQKFEWNVSWFYWNLTSTIFFFFNSQIEHRYRKITETSKPIIPFSIIFCYNFKIHTFLIFLAVFWILLDPEVHNETSWQRLFMFSVLTYPYSESLSSLLWIISLHFKGYTLWVLLAVINCFFIQSI